MEILRERNVGGTIYFPLIIAGGTAFATSGEYTPAPADSDYSVDGSSPVSTDGLVAYVGNGIWELDYVNSEVNGKVSIFIIQDVEIEDQAIIIQTYGDDSAGISWNTLADYIYRRAFGSARTSTRGDSPAEERNLLGMISQWVNKFGRSGTDLIGYREDDSTPHITRGFQSSPSAEVITELDPP